MVLQRLSTRTSPLKASNVQKQDFSYQYDGQTIAYSVWSTGSRSEIKTVVFLGAVQIGKLPAWIARRCPEGTVVVQGAPHWFAKDDGSDLVVFMRCFIKEVFATVLKTPHAKKLYIVAESQAVPGVVDFLTEDAHITEVGAVVLIQPLGVNAGAFAGTAEERLHLFKKRLAKNFRHQLPSLVSDPRLLYNHKQLLQTVGLSDAKSNAHYSIGLTGNAVEGLKKLCDAGIRILIVSGGNDTLFPSREIQSSLRKNNLDIPVVIVPGVPHSPLPTRQGMKLFNRALEYIETS